LNASAATILPPDTRVFWQPSRIKYRGAHVSLPRGCAARESWQHRVWRRRHGTIVTSRHTVFGLAFQESNTW